MIMRNFLLVFVCFLFGCLAKSYSQSYIPLHIAEPEVVHNEQPTRNQKTKYPRRLQNIHARFGNERCYILRRDGTMVYLRQKYNSRLQDYDVIESRPGTYKIMEYLMRDNTITAFVEIKFNDGATKNLEIYQGTDGYLHMHNGFGNYPKGEPLD